MQGNWSLQSVNARIAVRIESMNSNFVTLIIPLCLSLSVCAAESYAQVVEHESLPKHLRQTLEGNCVDCHSGSDAEANLSFDEILSSKSELELELIDDLIDVLESKSMPPEDGEPLSKEMRQSVVLELRDLFAAKVKSRPMPATPIRRMNRFQYNNAVQDLFDLKVDVFALPERMMREYNYYDPASGKMPDSVRVGSRPLGKSQLIGKRLAGVTPFPQDLRAENGFDNLAGILSLSPLLMESFLNLARSIVESGDFNASTVGVWNSHFEAPEHFDELTSEAKELELRKRLETFLNRAFRGAYTQASLDRYSNYAVQQINSGETFTSAMKEVSAAVISSPRFLYLYDDVDRGLALATRLSFFIWGSLPDEALIEAAKSDELSDPEVLSNQLHRMLNDRRSKRFCDSFPAQWLQLERIIASVPDPNVYPLFYFAKFRVSMHMMLEPLLVFETLLIENRPIHELIHSNFSYRSDLLRSWYRNDGKRGRTTPTAYPFDRVEITDQREGGVLTTAAVMTMTSGPDETKPITRGAWIAGVILNDPPEPPPADVPPLPPVEVDDSQTIRERFARHRDQPACAGCHRELDPLGFALENFDPVGHWRDQYENGRDVDPSGTLFHEYHFSNIEEFKSILLNDKTRFATAFTKHLLSFALGRELTVFDRLVVEDIVAQAGKSDYRLREVIRLVVTSKSFMQSASTGSEASEN